MDLRKLVRIATWEVTKSAGGVDRRTALVAIGAVVLLGAVGPAVIGGGVSLDTGIYRIGVTPDSPYHAVAVDDETFTVVPGATEKSIADGEVDLLIDGERIVVRPNEKGRAARATFRSAVERVNHDRLTTAANQSAAFPVRVTLRYRDQVDAQPQYGTDDGSDPTEGGSTSDGGDSDEDDGGGNASATDASGGTGGPGGLGSRLGSQDRVVDSPAAISPPFPFRSLVLAFVFVIPLNFLIQAYGSTILSERLNRRGELMLVSPVGRAEIIGGKTLPYFLGAIALEGAIALGVSLLVTGSPGGVLSTLAVAPLVLLFLGATFLGAMFARSFKELTFVTVSITVGLTSYAFVPAIFTDIGSVALISPLTIVVRDLQNEAVSLVEFAFSVTPPTLTALTLFGLGAGLYREEDMFTQRPIPLKVLDALAGPIRRPVHVGIVTAVLLPFVFLAEMLAVALLFALGEISVPLVFAFVAVIEEVGKSLHVYAAHTHRRFDTSLRTGLVLGAFSGLGFFLAEKLAVLAQLVGLPDLAAGQAALGPGITTGPLLLAFVLAPLGLHVGTAVISATGAARGRRAYVLALAVAVLVHFGYNIAVVGVVFGG